MTDLDEYLRAKEPDKRERAANWSAAIGLQKVDGLTPSQYLVETARRNIEGEITIQDAGRIIGEYYKSKKVRAEAAKTRTDEADFVAQRMAEVLCEPTFSFSPASYLAIHRKLFAGIYKFAENAYFFRNAILGESNNMQSRFLLVGTPDEPATLVPQRREQAGEQVKEQARAAFPLGVKRLIRIFSGEMSVVELMAALKLGGRRNFLEKYLTPAIENGLVEMTQPDSPRSPTQKYRLTAKGLAAKERGA